MMKTHKSLVSDTEELTTHLTEREFRGDEHVLSLSDDVIGKTADRVAEGVRRSLLSKWSGIDRGYDDIINVDAIPAPDRSARLHSRWDNYYGRSRDIGVTERDVLAVLGEAIGEEVRRLVIEETTAAIARARGRGWVD
jgi:hypothetical protein